MFKLAFALATIELIDQSSAAKVGSITKHDIEGMEKEQHELDEEVRAFEKNLEGLKTTVEFGPLSF
jgi:hypothetical protein